MKLTDGYTRQAHIDHILLCPSNLSDTDNPPLVNTATPSSVDANNSPLVDTSTDQDDDNITLPVVSSESCDASNNTGEPINRRPHRCCGPPKHLIEEMD